MFKNTESLIYIKYITEQWAYNWKIKCTRIYSNLWKANFGDKNYSHFFTFGHRNLKNTTYYYNNNFFLQSYFENTFFYDRLCQHARYVTVSSFSCLIIVIHFRRMFNVVHTNKTKWQVPQNILFKRLNQIV